MTNPDEMEPMTDDELVRLIEDHLTHSDGSWVNDTNLSEHRAMSTREYAQLPYGHLNPQGVSRVVDSSTTEVIDATTAILSDLFLSNSKIARFIPAQDTPDQIKKARDASLFVNHVIFKDNRGYEKLSSWIKSGLLWNTACIRWDYIEDIRIVTDTYEEMIQDDFEELMNDPNNELMDENEMEVESASLAAGLEPTPIYKNVKVKRRIDKSRVEISNIAPEDFRIARNASCVEEADFCAIDSSMAVSDIRSKWPDIAEQLDSEGQWDSLESNPNILRNHSDRYARNIASGSTYLDDVFNPRDEVRVIESWIRVDRDSDGIEELKHIITSGNVILFEENVDSIPVASFTPIGIPHEFYGLSMADLVRSSTTGSTALMRGIIDNVYLTNYAPKLFDPQTVRGEDLQNISPKKLIPVSGGNLANSVYQMPVETISPAAPVALQYLERHKEQATGISKATQGINDEMFVSGNDAEKFRAVQSAAQMRVNHIAKRFAESGLRDLIEGIYKMGKVAFASSKEIYSNGKYQRMNISELPEELQCDTAIDIGNNTAEQKIQKLQKVAEVLQQLNSNGMGIVVKPDAAAVLATQTVEALGLDSDDYLENYVDETFKERATQSIQQQTNISMKKQELEMSSLQANLDLQKANSQFTKQQSANTIQDNLRQTISALSEILVKQQDLKIKAAESESGVQVESLNMESIVTVAQEILQLSEQLEKKNEGNTEEQNEQQAPGEVLPGPV